MGDILCHPSEMLQKNEQQYQETIAENEGGVMICDTVE